MLLGSLPKGDHARTTFHDWKHEYMEKISQAIPESRFIHGDLVTDSIGLEMVVGHDLWLVKHSDIMIVHATSKIGAGTAQEMVMAKHFKKPVISVIPKDTHHRRSHVPFGGIIMEDWIHPFLYVSSDAVVENIDQAISWIRDYQQGKTAPVKDFSVFDDTVSQFENGLGDIVQEYKKQGW